MKHALIITLAAVIATAIGLQQAKAQNHVFVNTTTNRVNVECVPFVTDIAYSEHEMILSSSVGIKTYGTDTIQMVALKDKGLNFANILPASIMQKYAFEIPWRASLTSLQSTCETPIADSEHPDFEDFVENSKFTKTIRIHYDDAAPAASCDDNVEDVAIEISQNDVVVRSAAKHVEYILTGSTSNGSFKLYSEQKAKIVLNNLHLASENGAAINIQSKKRMFVVLADGSANHLADGATYQTPEGEDEKGCLFSEGQLCVSGNGTLSIEARHKNGLASDQYVRISNGKLQVVTHATKGTAIKTKDGFIQGGGYVQVLSEGDASKGIASDSTIVIKGGTLRAITTGGVIYDAKDDDYSSCSALKSKHDISIESGEVGSLSTGVGGKGINCGRNLTFGQQTATLPQPIIRAKTVGKRIPEVKESNEFTGPAASPKTIKAAGNITIWNGDIRVAAVGGDGGEGIESKGTTTISGGDITGFCVDDILNANDGLTINDGTLTGASLTNDGIDAVWLYCNGGYSYVVGGQSDQAAFDTDGKTFYNRGGTHLGIAGAMSSLPDYRSSNYSINALLKGSYHYLCLRDDQGQNMVAMQIPENYVKNKRGYNYGALFCLPNLLPNTTYTIYGATRLVSGTEQNGQILNPVFDDATPLFDVVTDKKNPLVQ